MSSPSREQLLKTARLFLEAFNEFTPESVVRYRSPSCTHQLAPASMKGKPQTNSEYSALINKIITVMPTGFRFQLVDGAEPIVDAVTRQVALHLRSTAESTLGLYQNEYVVILTLSQDGTEIDKIVEFVDSQYTNEWLPKLVEAADELAKSRE